MASDRRTRTANASLNQRSEGILGENALVLRAKKENPPWTVRRPCFNRLGGTGTDARSRGEGIHEKNAGPLEGAQGQRRERRESGLLGLHQRTGLCSDYCPSTTRQLSCQLRIRELATEGRQHVPSPESKP